MIALKECEGIPLRRFTELRELSFVAVGGLHRLRGALPDVHAVPHVVRSPLDYPRSRGLFALRSYVC